MVMADPNATVCERLTRRHGVRVVCAASVEDCCLAVGNVVGHENIVSASRMNSAIVVFLNDVEKVRKLTQNGIVMNNEMILVSPLSSPAKKVMLSNVPPFISDEGYRLDISLGACPERQSDPGVSERPGQDAAETGRGRPPCGRGPPATEGPGAAAAPDLTESEPQAQPAAQTPTGATSAPEEPRSARPDRKKPWSTEKSSVGSGAVLEPPALTEAGAEVQGNRMETPDTTPVQGDGGDVDMADEPVFNVPNKRKKQDTLSNVIADCDTADILILGGDFNCTTDDLDRNHAEPHVLPSKRMDRKGLVHAVRTESGDLLSESTEIRKQTVSFYSKLYSSEWSGAQVVEDSFLVGLPKLSERAPRELDRELSLRSFMRLSREWRMDGRQMIWSVMINTQEDVNVLAAILNDFQILSSAKVNWTKSEAILVGEWGGGQPTLPGGLAWKRGGFKYLGVYLGTNEFLNKNWKVL
ncbi:hypothetical protein QTP70_014505 [Hemibagrus guttatus]|uniref:Endonuclease/exonuclease/phosphatase domain-containing protein n=1 Tax=Hemibagrus guttatus TaxID=175788 RepID=A0AAE0R9I9_9TELE|nr:hypothetical protein QTP70_014505 [Hemibagrus guttatus]